MSIADSHRFSAVLIEAVEGHLLLSLSPLVLHCKSAPLKLSLVTQQASDWAVPV